jgi:hypothetical protein
MLLYRSLFIFQGSERLRLLVSDCSSTQNMLKCKGKEDNSEQGLPNSSSTAASQSPWVSYSTHKWCYMQVSLLTIHCIVILPKVGCAYLGQFLV